MEEDICECGHNSEDHRGGYAPWRDHPCLVEGCECEDYK